MPLYLSLIIDAAAFALVVFGVIIAGRRVETGLSVRRRLRGDSVQTRQPGAQSGLVRSQELRNPVLAWVQKTTLQDPAERTALRRDLALAGFDHPSAPAIYVVARFCLAVGLPAALMFLNAMRAKPATGFMLVMFALGLSVVGLIAPRGILDNRVKARKTLLENEFPDTLDLMVVCVESGLGLEGAILRVGAETAESHPRISAEFQIVSNELRAGRTRAEALRNMAERCQSEMLSAFVALLIQTDTLGGSIAQSLRIYSSEMRQHRMLRAEEKAMKLPVLLTVPLVLFILPVIMAAVLLPPVLDGMRTFLPAMAHVGK
ncbi:MAG TPA: type II secretion system F family protein [Caulobacteraceae bacterium]|jgi:tight adherence protein C|nr:type II secretion system F family protein [Caulobacteraceae bacterium]